MKNRHKFVWGGKTRARTQLSNAFVGSFTLAEQAVILGIYIDMRAASVMYMYRACRGGSVCRIFQSIVHDLTANFTSKSRKFT
jgi:hypothetical protein